MSGEFDAPPPDLSRLQGAVISDAAGRPICEIAFGFPKVVGNALITSDGRTFQLRLLDLLYFRIGITSAERLVQIYDDQIPTKG